MPNDDEAFLFLRALENYLITKLPGPSEVSSEIADIVAKAKSSANRHMAFPEGALLNRFVSPAIHEFLAVAQGLGHENAKKAFLSESHRKIPELASGSPGLSRGHPFGKIITTKPSKIIERWKGQHNKQASPLIGSFPDIALRFPSPHKIVFEAKYFPKGGTQKAETVFVEGAYQAFFYRSLPTVSETPKHPAWDYEYACFLAYDASRDGSLRKVWELLPEDVREGFWTGANVYIMILRGSEHRDSK